MEKGGTLANHPRGDALLCGTRSHPPLPPTHTLSLNDWTDQRYSSPCVRCRRLHAKVHPRPSASRARPATGQGVLRDPASISASNVIRSPGGGHTAAGGIALATDASFLCTLRISCAHAKTKKGVGALVPLFDSLCPFCCCPKRQLRA